MSLRPTSHPIARTRGSSANARRLSVLVIARLLLAALLCCITASREVGAQSPSLSLEERVAREEASLKETRSAIDGKLRVLATAQSVSEGVKTVRKELSKLSYETFEKNISELRKSIVGKIDSIKSSTQGSAEVRARVATNLENLLRQLEQLANELKSLKTKVSEYAAGLDQAEQDYEGLKFVLSARENLDQFRAFIAQLPPPVPVTDAAAQSPKSTAPSVQRGDVAQAAAQDCRTFVKVAGGTLPSSSELGAVVVRAFYLQKGELQWGEFQEVRTWAAAHGYDLKGVGAGAGSNYPVTNVNWYQALKWCNARSEKEGKMPVYRVNGTIYRMGDQVPLVNTSANGYRLPSEAEWEWAARGGTQTRGYTYSGGNDINAVGWCRDNSGNAIQLVGTKAANELGIHDMSGNVWEWCFDLYSASGAARVIRGGGWGNSAGGCAVGYRISYYPTGSSVLNGVRLALSSVP